MLKFPETQFLTSAWRIDQCPPADSPEVAFSGRSNAGKSSALNAITGRTHLARISKTPGRTQLINFFALATGGRLVDLPGYGYAKVPEDMKAHWRELLERFIETRACLHGLVVVMDIRRGVTDFDQQMVDWALSQGAPAHVLLTKADKLSRGEANGTLRSVRAQLSQEVSVQLFSAVEKTGVDEARRHVLRLLSTKRPARTE